MQLGFYALVFRKIWFKLMLWSILPLFGCWENVGKLEKKEKEKKQTLFAINLLHFINKSITWILFVTDCGESCWAT